MFAVAFLAVLGYAFAQEELTPHVTSSVACRAGWDAGVNSCYKVVNLRVHWVEAWGYCAAMRSSLVEIENQEEQDAIADIIKTKYSSYYEQFWTGLTDLSNEGQFVGARFNTNVTYTNFIKGQPNNDNGKGEHCIHINAKPFRNYQWNDHSCNAELNFICEDSPLA